jgi:hypothetical protein
MRPDGSFVSKMSIGTNDIEITGTWEVQSGVITMTLTNAKGVDASTLGSPVQSYKVIRISKDEIVCQLGSNTNVFVMTRR